MVVHNVGCCRSSHDFRSGWVTESRLLEAFIEVPLHNVTTAGSTTLKWACFIFQVNGIAFYKNNLSVLDWVQMHKNWPFTTDHLRSNVQHQKWGER